MKFMYRLMRVVMLAIVLTIGAGLLVAAVSASGWADALEWARVSRAEVLFGAVALLAIGLLVLLTGMDRDERERVLTFANDGGAVSISTRAISDFVGKLAAEFPSVQRMRPRIIPTHGKVDIIVDLRVKAGPQIHEMCELLQQRIRDSVTTGLGISEVRHVEVSVREIASEHRPDRV